MTDQSADDQTGRAADGAVAPSPVLVWFRDDLRLTDNPALTAAVASGRPVVAVYVLDDDPRLRPLGGANCWWLHHSLASLGASFVARGGALHLFRGRAETLILELATMIGAAGVTWNRRYGAAERAIDAAIKARLAAIGCPAQSFNGALLHEPFALRTAIGGSFKVFTPFWKAARASGPSAPVSPAPARIATPPLPAAFLERAMTLKALELHPSKPDWSGGLAARFVPGEAGALERLDRFLDGPLAGYADQRDRPDRPSTSCLSPHLRFGEISPRSVYSAAVFAADQACPGASNRDVDKFLSELGWREFSYHLLYHSPDLATVNVQRRFDAFPWRPDAALLRAWQQGQTGYPLVDAGMRELWQTGFMHNRLRMVVASFLIKHLLQDWRLGEAWFWDTLVDADAASNAASWQWVAGSGADAAPYFRIFNPVAQGEKFDPSGDYVRTFVPELSGLSASHIHRPWAAQPTILAAAGVILGKTYPRPIVDHDAARARALAAFASLKDQPGPD